jgi:hypothetical protein
MAQPAKRILRNLEGAAVVTLGLGVAGANGLYREGTDHIHDEMSTVDGDGKAEGNTKQILNILKSGDECGSVLTESKDMDNKDHVCVILSLAGS